MDKFNSLNKPNKSNFKRFLFCSNKHIKPTNQQKTMKKTIEFGKNQISYQDNIKTKVTINIVKFIEDEILNNDELFNYLVEDETIKIERNFDEMINNKEITFQVIKD
jgi:hypothetical protein